MLPSGRRGPSPLRVPAVPQAAGRSSPQVWPPPGGTGCPWQQSWKARRLARSFIKYLCGACCVPGLCHRSLPCVLAPAQRSTQSCSGLRLLVLSAAVRTLPPSQPSPPGLPGCPLLRLPCRPLPLPVPPAGQLMSLSLGCSPTPEASGTLHSHSSQICSNPTSRLCSRPKMSLLSGCHPDRDE